MQTAVMSWQMQLSVAPELGSRFPSIWSVYLPTLAFYIALVLVTWFAAPFICRLSLAPSTPAPDAPTTGVSWNEAMIFLFGTLFVAWGITRIADEIIQLMPKGGSDSRVQLDVANQLRFYVSIALTGAGAIMCFRFTSIHNWMQKRPKE